MVYRYAFRLTGRVPDAEDLTQLTFLTAVRKLDQLRQADRVVSWLLAVAATPSSSKVAVGSRCRRQAWDWTWSG